MKAMLIIMLIIILSVLSCVSCVGHEVNQEIKIRQLESKTVYLEQRIDSLCDEMCIMDQALQERIK